MSPTAATVALVVQVRDVEVLWLPDASRALTAKVWTFGEAFATLCGLEHATAAAPSSEQTNVVPASVSENVKLAFALESSNVAVSIDGAGGGVTSAGGELGG